MKKTDEIPFISVEEATPLVNTLVGMIDLLREENQRLASNLQELRNEIAILKGEKAKPKFKSSSSIHKYIYK